jgi:hypothetical protein
MLILRRPDHTLNNSIPGTCQRSCVVFLRCLNVFPALARLRSWLGRRRLRPEMRRHRPQCNVWSAWAQPAQPQLSAVLRGREDSDILLWLECAKRHVHRRCTATRYPPAYSHPPWGPPLVLHAVCTNSPPTAVGGTFTGCAASTPFQGTCTGACGIGYTGSLTATCTAPNTWTTSGSASQSVSFAGWLAVPLCKTQKYFGAGPDVEPKGVVCNVPVPPKHVNCSCGRVMLVLTLHL